MSAGATVNVTPCRRRHSAGEVSWSDACVDDGNFGRRSNPPGCLGGSAFAEPPYVLRVVLTHQQTHQPGTDPPTKNVDDREETSSDSRVPFAHKRQHNNPEPANGSS